MSETNFAAVDEYIAELLVEDDPALKAALAPSEAAGLPQINVAPNQGKLLMLLAQAIGARQDPGNRHARRLQHDLARACSSSGRGPCNA
jgi:hypothetical protein